MATEEHKENLLNVAVQDPEKLWSEVVNLGYWFKPWTQTLDSSNKPIYRWFVGGETNICYNLLDRHVLNGNGDKVATIWESAATKTGGKATYNELLDQVSKFGGVLKNFNVEKGDVVFIYMPNIYEQIVAILATWRIGAVILTLLPNTTANSLADRIELSKPKIFVTSNATKIKNDDVYFKKSLDQAIEKLNYHRKVIVFQRKEFDPATMNPDKDVLWEDVMQSAESILQCVPTESTQAAMISCSSGTTGKPKGITYMTGGFLALLCNRIHTGNLYKFNTARVTLTPSHPGWMSGVYGILVPMIECCCGIIYDGDGTGNGDIDTIYRIIEKHKPSLVVFNVATLRDLRLADPDGVHAKKFDLSAITSTGTGGEVLDQLSREWANKVFPVTVLDAWGQTEGCAAMENLQKLQNKDLGHEERFAKFPGPGFTCLCDYQLRITTFSDKIFDEEGQEVPTGETGCIAAKLPLPPYTAQTLYQDDDLYKKEYCSSYPGYFNTKDLGWMDKNGGLHIVGRGDDIMKVSGVTMSTTEVENAILQNPDIAQCVVVPLKHKEMYMTPVAFYTLKEGIHKQENEILNKMKEDVRESFGPAVIFSFACEVKVIPMSLTGKITRKPIQTELQKLINEVSHEDNPDLILKYIREAAANLGML